MRNLFSSISEKNDEWADFNYDKYIDRVHNIKEIREMGNNDLINQVHGYNDANLTLDELKALEQYQCFSYNMNLLFQSNLPDIYEMFDKREIVHSRTIFTRFDIEDIVNLYSAIYKIYTNKIDTDPYFCDALKSTILHKGIRSKKVISSLGFKSFSLDRDIADGFSLYSDNSDIVHGVVIDAKFPGNIPFVTSDDLFKYVPFSGRREEKEFLFSPFSYFVLSEKFGYRKGYKLEAYEINPSKLDDIDIDRILYEMNVLLHEYEVIKSKNNSNNDVSEELIKLDELYQKKYLIIFKYISNLCVKKKEDIDFNRNRKSSHVR